MQAIERYTEPLDWITIIFIICFILIVIVRNLYTNRFNEFLSILTSNKFMLFRGKENNAFHGFNILLFSVNALSISVLIFWLYKYYTNPAPADYILIYIRILTAYVCFILLKFGVEKIISNIFNIDKVIDIYLFQKLSYRNFISLLVFPLTLLLIYTFNISDMWVYGMVGFILFANLTGIFNIFKQYQKLISGHWFYFILYLCALEIAPYFILYKLITVY
ncbi:DUF4271 domain-containing protein [Zunongwangia sp. SCSIO 43204]|uniref:DUF4271 domain-containing protein n=1 Tax=Zunongwangia mangrovi TaxID=1334022 RepID=A0A1I1D7F3_9FLAO|nr:MULTISPECIES: DUF4271 domain-containing protein [Zunongwangia]UAB84887.1 DUF4271 domain-containing protein [Zunongwangia sp. SCSIO 43204]SFB70855.1 protein of unknown function [Zunongwangia mangrovi]